jgi:hypothetical protein
MLTIQRNDWYEKNEPLFCIGYRASMYIIIDGKPNAVVWEIIDMTDGIPIWSQVQEGR